jgi:hypothetical protein
MNRIFHTTTCNRLADGASHLHFDGESTERAWAALNPHGGIGMHALRTYLTFLTMTIAFQYQMFLRCQVSALNSFVTDKLLVLTTTSNSEVVLAICPTPAKMELRVP